MSNFYTRFIKPPDALQDYVESIGMFRNASDAVKEVVIVPDGRVDLFFWRPGNGYFQVMLMGLETAPDHRSILPGSIAFVISFKPIAVEYILHTQIADILNSAREMPADFWGLGEDVLLDFDAFYHKVTARVQENMPAEVDNRKLELFNLIYASDGEMTVHELSEKVYWSSRQINRYFTQQFGLSLKAFCTILRFRVSLGHIAKGELYPGMNFTDQNHFIKEIKKFSGVVPKDLAKNANDRFILLSVLKQK
jgi:AraC-like DNA-binding protein